MNLDRIIEKLPKREKIYITEYPVNYDNWVAFTDLPQELRNTLYTNKTMLQKQGVQNISRLIKKLNSRLYVNISLLANFKNFVDILKREILILKEELQKRGFNDNKLAKYLTEQSEFFKNKPATFYNLLRESIYIPETKYRYKMSYDLIEAYKNLKKLVEKGE